MKPSFDLIRSAAFGTERVEQKDGKIQFFRFTKAEEEVYKNGERVDFYEKTFCTSGVRLSFKSDTKKLSFFYELLNRPSRKYAYFDVFCNGALYRHFGCETEEITSASVSVTFPEGEKDIEIYFPWTAKTVISDFEIDDGASFIPTKRKITMINYGDSITQGYDAAYPSLSYASVISRLLDADSVNKAIGGERFCPELLVEANGKPDIVTVAYGINDWANYTYDYIKERSRKFYKRVSELYPESKIFVITPINYLNSGVSDFGAPAIEVDKLLRENCRDLPNVTVIRGWYFTPDLPEFYYDKVLHPNDLGFSLYAENLYKEMLKYL